MIFLYEYGDKLLVAFLLCVFVILLFDTSPDSPKARFLEGCGTGALSCLFTLINGKKKE